MKSDTIMNTLNLNLGEKIINPLTPRSNFVILLTVNHEILMSYFREFSIGSTNYLQIENFLYSCHLIGWHCIGESSHRLQKWQTWKM